MKKTGFLKKIFSFILLLACSTALFAYQANITVNVKNKTIKDVITIIQNQSEYKFMYNTKLVDVDQLVSVDCKDESLQSVLNVVFAGKGISWKIADKQIVLSASDDMADSNDNQQKLLNIKGVVTDAQSAETLVGVVVSVVGNDNVAYTNVDGKYSIEAPVDATLKFSYLGMKDLTAKVNGKSILNIAMEQDITALSDVVVTGYQTISKERAAGSFAVITPKEIESKLNLNVLDRIEGSVAGLNIVKNGDSKSIQIRGVSTINGDQNPLFVVDGVPFEGEPGIYGDNTTPLDLINPADIANITVLKDASAASIYGARSANGVVVITTKSGQKGATKVNYSGSVKFQGLPDRDYSHIMNSSELVDYQFLIMETNPSVSRKDQYNFQNPVQVHILDYQEGLIDKATLDARLEPYRHLDRYEQVKDEFLRNNSVVQQHNLSFSGGSDIYKYSVSLNYTGDAPYEKVQYKNRYGFNIKNTFDFFKWLKVDANILGSTMSYDYDCGTLGMNLLNTGGASYYMLRDETGDELEWFNTKSKYEINRLISVGLLDESYYPISDLNTRHYTVKQNYLNLNLGARIKIMDGLNVNFRFQRETTNGFTKDYWTKNNYSIKTMINDAAQIQNGKITYNIPLGGQVVQNNIDNFSYTVRGQVDYSKDFNPKHNLQVIAGAEARKVVTSSNGFYRLGYDDDNLSYSKVDDLLLSSGISGTESLNGYFYFTSHTKGEPATTYVDNRYVSFYGNASWQYDNRLTVTASIRMDQSNLFGTDPKYQYRPLWSAGASYVALEDYNWIDRLVVRATYGINGNIPKLNGPYLIASVGSNQYYTKENTMYISSPPNESLRWEKTKVFNIGVDFNLLKNRLNGSIEYYNKNTTDLLGDFSVDPTLGWSSVDMNFGSMFNRGVEIALNSINVEKHEISWRTSATFSYNKNEITDIETSSETASSYWSGLNNRVGYPMGALFSVRYKGLNEEGIPVAYTADGSEVANYKNLTKDDLVYSGTYNPPFSASLTNTLSYKGFDLSFMFVYQGGHVIRDIAARYCITTHPNYAVSNTYKEMANFWQKPGDENDPDINPAYMFQRTNIRNGEYIWKAADKHIQKGDYIKLRNVSLAYALPESLLKRTPISGARVILQATNLWWWAANDGDLDPEIYSGYSLTPNRGTLYPATFTIGLNLNF